MDKQDNRGTHTQGHENHGVHVCQKCGWPFPNPHPSAKHRRAHKKLCGTIEGYTLLVSECQSQIHFNPSDDEHLSDDDHKRQGPKALDTGGDNEEVSGGIGENSIRSVDEVFSDAVADFSDGVLSPGVKEPLRDSLDSATDVEIMHRRYQEFSSSSGDNGSNDENQLMVKSSNDDQMQYPKTVQSERVEDSNMMEFQGQLSSFTVNPLTSLVADSEAEELTEVPTNDCFELTSNSKHSKSEALSDGLLDNKIYTGKIAISKENDEIISDKDMVEIVVSSEETEGEAFPGVSKIAVSDVDSNYQLAEGASNLEEKNNTEFPSMMTHDDLPLEVDFSVSTYAFISGIRIEPADITEHATSGDVKTLLEMEEGNVHALSHPSCNDRPAHTQSDYEDCGSNIDHEVVVSENSSSLYASKALKLEQNDLKDSDTEGNDFLINLGQLSEEREVFTQDMHAWSSEIKEQVNYEPVAEEMHAEESIEVSPVTFKVESSKRLDDNGASMNAMKTEMNENHIVHSTEEQGSDDVHKISQWVDLPESSFMAVSNENPSDASFGSAASETTTVISSDNRSYHEKNITGISDIAVDGKCSGVNSGNYTGISMKTPLPNHLHFEIKPSCLYKSEDTERPTVDDDPLAADSNIESQILSKVVIDGSEGTLKDTDCTSRVPLSGAQEDFKDDEINGNDKLSKDDNRFADTTADSHQALDGEVLLKATESLGRNPSSHSLTIEPCAQHVSSFEDNQDGEPGKEVPGVIAVPAQDQSVTNDVKLASSAIYTSIDPGNQFDSSEANWGSVSDIGELNLKQPSSASASERQQSEATEMFEPPSFMTLVEPGHAVGAKAAASEVQTEPNKQHPDLISAQAGWFPTLTHVTNESQGRKRNEEIIAKVTKQNTPLKSLLSEASNNGKPKSPKLEKNPVDYSSGLVTVNSILGRESPAVQFMKREESPNEWNSSASSNPAEIKRENKKDKSKPYWIQFLCCSSVDTK